MVIGPPAVCAAVPAPRAAALRRLRRARTEQNVSVEGSDHAKAGVVRAAEADGTA